MSSQLPRRRLCRPSRIFTAESGVANLLSIHARQSEGLTRSQRFEAKMRPEPRSPPTLIASTRTSVLARTAIEKPLYECDAVEVVRCDRKDVVILYTILHA